MDQDLPWALFFEASSVSSIRKTATLSNGAGNMARISGLRGSLRVVVANMARKNSKYMSR